MVYHKSRASYLWYHKNWNYWANWFKKLCEFSYTLGDSLCVVFITEVAQIFAQLFPTVKLKSLTLTLTKKCVGYNFYTLIWSPRPGLTRTFCAATGTCPTSSRCPTWTSFATWSRPTSGKTWTSATCRCRAYPFEVHVCTYICNLIRICHHVYGSWCRYKLQTHLDNANEFPIRA
jgi:hypothetical protein